jgi:hypothetical protein
MRATQHPLLFGVAVTALITGLGTAALLYASEDHQPSPGQVASAQQVSDLMVNELVAALFKECDETTPQNVEHGKQAISLIFNDLNRNMRLIGAVPPLQGGHNDRPADSFETTALAKTLTGQPHAAVQRVNDTWYYRRSDDDKDQ